MVLLIKHQGALTLNSFRLRRKKREAPKMDPRAVPPAAKKRRPASQAGTENPGAGSGSHTGGRG